MTVDKGTVLVTGASRGIGRETAKVFAERGYRVWAGMRNPSDEIVIEAGGNGRLIKPVRLDVTRPLEPELPSDLRILVNNAGTRLEYLPVEETPADLWRETFETNLFGLVELTRRAIPLLREHGGVICNVTSSALLTPLPFMAAYRASKAAVQALSETLRTELRPFGIRVIDVMPGPIATEMYNDSIAVRPPEAIAYPVYQPMASRSGGIATAMKGHVTTPREAAIDIVDAIEEESSPPRVGCDPASKGLLSRGGHDADSDGMQRVAVWFADQ